MSPALPQNGPSVAPPGGRRRRWFRLIAVLLPLLALAAIEGTLRLRGRHSPTGYWIPTEIPGELMPNPQFANRFVGSVLARMPRSTRVPERASGKTLRIVVFGESAALGDPEPAFGMSRFLEALLEARYPGRPIEVINTAITALNSYAIREAARDSRRLQADFWLIYAGNNEVIGPFGPASVGAGGLPGLTTVRLGLRLRQTAFGQWLTDHPAAAGDGLSMTQRWTGLEMFLNHQVTADDPRLPAMRDNFAANLRDTVNLGRSAGAKVLLSTMAVNLVDCPPFTSVSAGQTNRPGYAAWTAAVAAARALDEQGALPEAIAAWTNAIALWPEDAETQYRLGMAHLNAGANAAGRAALERARDLDTLRFRADSGVIQVTREVAKAFPPDSVRLVDADRDLRGAEADRPPGADLFLEHVHLRPEGNYRLARLFAEQIAQWLGETGNATPWREFEPCLERLGGSPFAEARLWSQTRALCDRPPFSQQSNAELRNRFIDDRLAEANRGVRPAGFTNAVDRIRTVVTQHPTDAHLREQLARLLQSGRRWADAGAEWQQVVALAPAHVVAWYQLGESLAAGGNPTGAQAAYEHALTLRPDFVEASLGLGLVLGGTGKLDAAVRALDRALVLAPRNLQARVNHGVALVGLGRIDEGTADLRRAAAEHPSATVPLERLAEMYSGQKAYAKSAEALTEASRREPRNPLLRHRLAIELSRSGQPAEAEAEFRKVIEMQPNFMAARLDLGVALAQRSRFQEAIPEFEAALKLQPTNAQARAYLQQARTKLNQN